MSQRALLLATRDTLRTALQGLAVIEFIPEQCDITFDGRPLPVSNELFVAIWPGRWTNEYEEGIEEIYGVNVTVSVGLTKVPQDRIGPEMMVKQATSLDAILEVTRINVHSNYVLMNLANTTITNAANGFIRPLYFKDGGSPQLKRGDWWYGQGKERFAALVQTLRFDDAQRDQTIESMT